MKISKDQKDKNKKKMIEIAVKKMGEGGISNTTMKEISQKAGFSEPVIYKYFPTKEHLLFSYFEEAFLEIKDELKNNLVFQELSFAEQLQMLMNSTVEYHSKNRAFVVAAFKSIFSYNLSVTVEELEKHKGQFLEFINQLLDVAIDSEELPDIPYRDFITKSLWDYHIYMVSYWARDDSEDYEKTTQLIDKTVGLLHAVLESKILDKSMDLVSFFLRQHIFSSLETLQGVGAALELKNKRRDSFGKHILSKNKPPKNKSGKKR